ncbi:hypothetical protein SSSV4_ORF59 [Sulfolobus spindle-shaped virus 4]|uniref:Uncharacterized protein n=2 Tax=Alphafusellovirus TaxID=10475 RepID=A8TKI8_9VIRU|nr:hypothetical protein SSSV4_ORF59 [Sulfolobus spindle-shaped virus 4]YP_002221487.1 hypothetical protein SSSV5_gp22 [Sulfolobus spindle-shaped virus 5]ABV26209.1 hypothetical protein [Sulfolobus spindle-shaped virus 4]ABV26243.1 hypothetical protein [Sulfolobus spindle-shaped virus 5]
MYFSTPLINLSIYQSKYINLSVYLSLFNLSILSNNTLNISYASLASLESDIFNILRNSV